MRYETLFEMFKTHISKPQDYTDSFWYTVGRSEFHYSMSGEKSKNPEDWVGGGYSSDRATGIYTKKGYRLITLDDGCGGEFQAFFSLAKQIDPEDFY